MALLQVDVLGVELDSHVHLLRGSLEDVDDELRNQVEPLVGIAYHEDLHHVLAGLTTSERGFADEGVSLAEVHLAGIDEVSTTDHENSD